MPTISVDELYRLSVNLLTAAGARAGDAQLIGNALIEANLAGHDSHGIIRLLNYVEWARAGTIRPTVSPEVLSKDGATARVDAGWGWGQVAMSLAVETVIELAEAHGIGIVAVRRCNHIGRLAPYVARVAESGMIGLAITNANAAVAPYGGRQRVFGTNPIAWGAPRGRGQPPIVHDIATSAVAEGKLRVARAKGEPVAPGLILDAAGQPSTDPDDFYEGGTLLPFGAHKGSGLSVLIQLLGRGLADAKPEDLARHRGGNGPLIIAIDTRRFGDFDDFTREADALCAEIVGTPPSDGFPEVLLPDGPEQRMRDQRLAEGVPVPDRTWSELTELSRDLGVDY